jgi:hypothetical protein
MNMRLLFFGYFILVNNAASLIALDEPRRLVGRIDILKESLLKMEHCHPSWRLHQNLKNIIGADGKPLQLKSTDVLVHVGVGDIDYDEKGNSIDWVNHEDPDLGFGNFPERLPFAMLDGKEKGEIISFRFKNPDTKKMFLIELQQHEPDTFAATLQQLKKQFDDPAAVEKAEAYYGSNRKKWASRLQKEVDHSFNGFMPHYRDAMQ